jgi:hypothetical protein
MNVNTPPNAIVFFTYFNDIINMEPISIDEILIDKLNLDYTEPLSPNFEMLSYPSLHTTTNFGFSCVWYILFPSGFFICWILRKAFNKCKKEKGFLRRIRDIYLSNGLILFFNTSYLSSCVCFFLSTKYMKFDTTGNIVNSCFSIVLALVIVFFPIFVWVFYTHNFDKILKEDRKFLSKWGGLIEPLNFKRRGKSVILFPVASLVRKLILAATMVYAQ